MDVFDLIGGKISYVSKTEKLMIEKDNRIFYVWVNDKELMFAEMFDKKPEDDY